MFNELGDCKLARWSQHAVARCHLFFRGGGKRRRQGQEEKEDFIWKL